MTRLTFLLVLTSFLSLQGFAQHTHQRGVCGTNDVDLDRLKRNIAYAKANPLQSRAITYVPIRYNLIGEADGTNAASPNSLLDLMTAVNVDYLPHEIQFFLEDGDGMPWDVTYHDGLYSDHADFTSFLRSNKASNAITVYVPNTATPPNSSGLGTTLGYYSPSGDYLVFKKSEVNSNASTASHEIGHYLSLPHPFVGWDCTSWEGTTNEYTTSPVTITTAPCSNVRVELVSRGADGNCATAGDLFCDTPADYNLGFGYNSCNYTGDVQDATGTPLRPQENNFMGYFLDCNPYTFSAEQVAAIGADLASSDRNFLRGTSPTSTEAVVDLATIVYPLDESTSLYSDQVTLDWDPVDNAKYYYVEFSDRGSMRNLIYSDITTATSAVVTGLEANETYFFRVRAFSQTSYGDYGTITEFTTGSVSGLGAQPQAVTSMTLYPNPSAVGASTTLKLESAQAGEVTLTIRDLTGRTLSSSIELLQAGDNTINLVGQTPTVKGSYTLTVSNGKGISSQKFEVF